MFSKIWEPIKSEEKVLKVNKKLTQLKIAYIFTIIIFMAIGELSYMILRLQRDCNPRRNLKHKANQFNRERLEVENTGCFLLLCNYLKLYHILSLFTILSGRRFILLKFKINTLNNKLC